MQIYGERAAELLGKPNPYEKELIRYLSTFGPAAAADTPAPGGEAVTGTDTVDAILAAGEK